MSTQADPPIQWLHGRRILQLAQKTFPGRRFSLSSFVYWARRNEMPQFIYLLHDTPGFFSKLSPQEIQAVIEKYKKWGQSMREKNKLVGGQKLEDTTGRVLRGQTMTDGPYAESKEVIGGYYIVD